MISPNPHLPSVIHCTIAPEGMIRTRMTRFRRVDHRHCRALYEHSFPTVNLLLMQHSSVDAWFTCESISFSQQQQPILFVLQQVVFFKEYSVFVTLHLLWVQRSSVDARFTLTNNSNNSLAAGAMFFGGCMIYPYKWHQQPIFFILQQVVFFKEYSIFSALHLLLM